MKALPAYVLVRSAFRAILAGIAYGLGYTATGHILAVLAVMSTLGAVEMQAAKRVAEWMKGKPT